MVIRWIYVIIFGLFMVVALNNCGKMEVTKDAADKIDQPKKPENVEQNNNNEVLKHGGLPGELRLSGPIVIDVNLGQKGLDQRLSLQFTGGLNAKKVNEPVDVKTLLKLKPASIIDKDKWDVGSEQYMLLGCEPSAFPGKLEDFIDKQIELTYVEAAKSFLHPDLPVVKVNTLIVCGPVTILGKTIQLLANRLVLANASLSIPLATAQTITLLAQNLTLIEKNKIVSGSAAKGGDIAIQVPYQGTPDTTVASSLELSVGEKIEGDGHLLFEMYGGDYHEVK